VNTRSSRGGRGSFRGGRTVSNGDRSQPNRRSRAIIQRHCSQNAMISGLAADPREASEFVNAALELSKDDPDFLLMQLGGADGRGPGLQAVQGICSPSCLSRLLQVHSHPEESIEY
jgi:hypothetical protein